MKHQRLVYWYLAFGDWHRDTTTFTFAVHLENISWFIQINQEWHQCPARYLTLKWNDAIAPELVLFVNIVFCSLNTVDYTLHIVHIAHTACCALHGTTQPEFSVNIVSKLLQHFSVRTSFEHGLQSILSQFHLPLYVRAPFGVIHLFLPCGFQRLEGLVFSGLKSGNNSLLW